MLLRVLQIQENTAVCDKSMSERRFKFIGRSTWKEGVLVELYFDSMRTSGDEVCFYIDGYSHCLFKVFWSNGKWKIDHYTELRANMITMPVRKEVWDWKVTSMKELDSS